MRSSSAVWLAARSAAFWGLSESALVRRGLEWILAALLRLRDPLHLCYTAADLRAAVGIGVAADDTAAMLAAPSMALYLFHLYYHHHYYYYRSRLCPDYPFSPI